MLVQKLLIGEYLPRIPIRHDQTFIHLNRAENTVNPEVLKSAAGL
jgi:hypothetical protein